MFQGPFQRVSGEFREALTEISRLSKECLKGDFKKVQKPFKQVASECQEAFNDVSRVFYGSLMEVLRVFQGCSKKILDVL